MLRYIVFFLMLFMLGCGGCDDKKPLQTVDLKEEAKKTEVHFKRFDTDLFGSDFTNPDAASQLLYQKYGGFYCNFIEGDLMLAACNSDSVGRLLKPFVTNRDILDTHKEVEKTFTPEKIQELDEELTSCIQRWNHYFPDSIVPEVIYYQSAWNSNIATTDSTIGIALDCYLGYSNKITKQLSNDAFPNYKKKNMEARFIVSDAMKGWAAYKSRAFYEQKDLLNELIFYGKLMYIAEALAPDVADSTMMNWDQEELQWAEKHEWSIWKTIANEKTMFQTRSFEINKWFTDGPFTGAANVPQDSPPQLGVWLGWKIVRQYMEKNPQLTPQDLLQEKNNQKILAAFTPNK
jgi:hypothetical protein